MNKYNPRHKPVGAISIPRFTDEETEAWGGHQLTTVRQGNLETYQATQLLNMCLEPPPLTASWKNHTASQSRENGLPTRALFSSVTGRAKNRQLFCQFFFEIRGGIYGGLLERDG